MKKTDPVLRSIWHRLWQLSKKENTRSCYDSHLRMLEKTFYPFEQRFLGRALEDVAIWIGLMDGGGRPQASIGTVRGVVSAVREYYRGNRLVQPKEVNDHIDILVEGFARANGGGRVDYAPMDWPRFSRFMNWYQRQSDFEPETAWGMIFEWAFALRVNQVSKIKACDHSLGAGTWIYCCPRQKGHGSTGAMENHECAPQLNARVGQRLLQEPAGSARLMFPNYSPVTVNKIIQRAAGELGWEDDLRWSSHSIRNGSIYDARLLGGLAGAILRGGHSSLSMAVYYSRPLEERRRRLVSARVPASTTRARTKRSKSAAGRRAGSCVRLSMRR